MTEAAAPSVGIRDQALRLIARREFRPLISNARQFLNAKWALRSATSTGRIRLAGRAAVINHGTMIIGDRVRLDGTTVRLELVAWGGATLSIGDGTFINYGTNVSAMTGVSIGRNCEIGQYGIIMDSDYHSAEDHRSMGRSEPIVIGDNVWIGARVIVLRGSHIGAGAVIGANSLVNGPIPANTLAAGSPARVIRRLRDD